ncbi:hypothetical protein EDEG_01439 [Edhazardia aedis USNM 41457]|uniref:Uncharacterized protein n=1 Tax=Edhazardia aedis (strain USNM 41457) TaxID=1003232 RepID=J9DSJ0_EDHAE|nr:hypothetical protein EDEG_01439 [Edhazardia aedis USNM 41457]|eukprot:EJW04292.1 hypothetical protein EDEG_01439 [Edhazardia aedis USNM 41457]
MSIEKILRNRKNTLYWILTVVPVSVLSVFCTLCFIAFYKPETICGVQLCTHEITVKVKDSAEPLAADQQATSEVLDADKHKEAMRNLGLEKDKRFKELLEKYKQLQRKLVRMINYTHENLYLTKVQSPYGGKAQQQKVADSSIKDVRKKSAGRIVTVKSVGDFDIDQFTDDISRALKSECETMQKWLPKNDFFTILSKHVATSPYKEVFDELLQLQQLVSVVSNVNEEKIKTAEQKIKEVQEQLAKLKDTSASASNTAPVEPNANTNTSDPNAIKSDPNASAASAAIPLPAPVTPQTTGEIRRLEKRLKELEGELQNLRKDGDAVTSKKETLLQSIKAKLNLSDEDYRNAEKNGLDDLYKLVDEFLQCIVKNGDKKIADTTHEVFAFSTHSETEDMVKSLKARIKSLETEIEEISKKANRGTNELAPKLTDEIINDISNILAPSAQQQQAVTFDAHKAEIEKIVAEILRAANSSENDDTKAIIPQIHSASQKFYAAAQTKQGSANDTQLSTLKDKVVSLKATLMDEQKKLAGAIAAKDVIVQQHTTQLQSLQNDLQAASSKVCDLENCLQKSAQDLDTLKKEYATSQSENSDLLKTNQDLVDEKAALLAGASKEKSQLEQDIQDLNDNLNKTKAEIADLQTQVQTANDLVHSLTGEKKKLEEDIAKAEQDARSKIDALAVKANTLEEENVQLCTAHKATLSEYVEFCENFKFLHSLINTQIVELVNDNVAHITRKNVHNYTAATATANPATASSAAQKTNVEVLDEQWSRLYNKAVTVAPNGTSKHVKNSFGAHRSPESTIVLLQYYIQRFLQRTSLDINIIAKAIDQNAQDIPLPVDPENLDVFSSFLTLDKIDKTLSQILNFCTHMESEVMTSNSYIADRIERKLLACETTNSAAIGTFKQHLEKLLRKCKFDDDKNLVLDSADVADSAVEWFNAAGVGKFTVKMQDDTTAIKSAAEDIIQLHVNENTKILLDSMTQAYKEAQVFSDASEKQMKKIQEIADNHQKNISSVVSLIDSCDSNLTDDIQQQLETQKNNYIEFARLANCGYSIESAMHLITIIEDNFNQLLTATTLPDFSQLTQMRKVYNTINQHMQAKTAANNALQVTIDQMGAGLETMFKEYVQNMQSLQVNIWLTDADSYQKGQGPSPGVQFANKDNIPLYKYEYTSNLKVRIENTFDWKNQDHIDQLRLFIDETEALRKYIISSINTNRDKIDDLIKNNAKTSDEQNQLDDLQSVMQPLESFLAAISPRKTIPVSICEFKISHILDQLIQNYKIEDCVDIIEKIKNDFTVTLDFTPLNKPQNTKDIDYRLNLTIYTLHFIYTEFSKALTSLSSILADTMNYCNKCNQALTTEPTTTSLFAKVLVTLENKIDDDKNKLNTLIQGFNDHQRVIFYFLEMTAQAEEFLEYPGYVLPSNTSQNTNKVNNYYMSYSSEINTAFETKYSKVHKLLQLMFKDYSNAIDSFSKELNTNLIIYKEDIDYILTKLDIITQHQAAIQIQEALYNQTQQTPNRFVDIKKINFILNRVAICENAVKNSSDVMYDKIQYLQDYITNTFKVQTLHSIDQAFTEVKQKAIEQNTSNEEITQKIIDPNTLQLANIECKEDECKQLITKVLDRLQLDDIRNSILKNIKDLFEQFSQYVDVQYNTFLKDYNEHKEISKEFDDLKNSQKIKLYTGSPQSSPPQQP